MADDPNTIDGIPIRSEQIGFSADEMIFCGKCSKPNPPNRLNCFYCGEGLKLPSEIAAGLQFRPSEIEDWEPGINIVVTDGLKDADPKAIASTVSVDADIVESLSSMEPPLPLFRVKLEEADEVEARSRQLGLTVVRVEDRALGLTKPSTRLKGLSFGSEALVFHPFNAGDPVPVSVFDIETVVTGSIIVTSAESKLRKTRKETKEFDEHLSSSDHGVIDIYTRGNDAGFRILSHGFDFSCLGAKKTLLAGENVKVLIGELTSLLPNTVFDRSYLSKLALLDRTWPRTVTNTSKGIERNWLSLHRSTGSTTSNEEQFTRYSRMRRKLI